MANDIDDSLQINELAQKLDEYDFLEIQLDKIGLTVYNKNINKILALYRMPFREIYGHIEDYNTGKRKMIRKPQFDRALNHLFRMANEIKTTSNGKD